MARHFRLITTVLCAACIITGCVQNNRQSSNAEPLAMDSIRIGLQYPPTTDTTPICQVTIGLTYPVGFQDQTLSTNLNTLLATLLFGEEYASFTSLPVVADSVANQTLGQLCAMRMPLGNEGFASNETFCTEIQAAPVYNDGEFLVYHRYWYSYEGGAHGMYADTYDVIYLPAMTRLSLNDIFSPECIEKIDKMLIQQLLKDQNLSNTDELNDAGYFDAENIKATENFYIDSLGITWAYTPYEIGCYAIGETHITLPYEEISYYIAENSPLYKLINNHK